MFRLCGKLKKLGVPLPTHVIFYETTGRINRDYKNGNDHGNRSPSKTQDFQSGSHFNYMGSRCCEWEQGVVSVIVDRGRGRR